MRLINRKIFQQLLNSIAISSDMSLEEMNTITQPLVEYLRTHSIPQKLYRFKSVDEKSLDALKKDQCYVSPPQLFNDPFDSIFLLKQDKFMKLFDNYTPKELAIIFKIWIFDKNISKLYEKMIGKKAVESIRTMINKTDEKFLDTLDSNLKNYLLDIINNIGGMLRNYCIACFCGKLNSTLMWSHYANNHKGFALEYDLSNYKFYNDDNFSISIYPVIYSRKQYTANDVALSFVIRSMGIDAKNPDITCFMKCALHKSSIWKYENEWRMLVLKKNDNDYSKPFPIKLRPKAIYYGINIPEEDKKIIHKIAKEKN
jgi:Protein of unknown function (DUF2971).